jgi:RimJ/RimL family protein N-acetyltransferase
LALSRPANLKQLGVRKAVTIRLVQIGTEGRPVEDLPAPELVRSLCDQAAALYQRVSFVPPWVAYLTIRDGQAIGTCAFKSPPVDGRVEIAYFTFPDHEGQGLATEMARQLVQLAHETDRSLVVAAQTLPHENASTSILRKLGFNCVGTAQDDEAGEVWQWQVRATVS